MWWSAGDDEVEFAAFQKCAGGAGSSANPAAPVIGEMHDAAEYSAQS
jgi:hypothetical protein